MQQQPNSKHEPSSSSPQDLNRDTRTLYVLHQERIPERTRRFFSMLLRCTMHIYIYMYMPLLEVRTLKLAK